MPMPSIDHSRSVCLRWMKKTTELSSLKLCLGLWNQEKKKKTLQLRILIVILLCTYFLPFLANISSAYLFKISFQGEFPMFSL